MWKCLYTDKYAKIVPRSSFMHHKISLLHRSVLHFSMLIDIHDLGHSSCLMLINGPACLKWKHNPTPLDIKNIKILKKMFTCAGNRCDSSTRPFILTSALLAVYETCGGLLTSVSPPPVTVGGNMPLFSPSVFHLTRRDS